MKYSVDDIIEEKSKTELQIAKEVCVCRVRSDALWAVGNFGGALELEKRILELFPDDKFCRLRIKHCEILLTEGLMN